MLLKESPHLLPPQLKKYNAFWSNALKDKTKGRGSGGLLCLIKTEFHPTAIEITPWWIFCRLLIGSSYLIVGSVYFKPTLQMEVILEMLQLTLQEIQDKYPSDIIIIGGDVNADVADFEDDLLPLVTQDSYLAEHRETLVGSTNLRGEILMNFMLENEFILLNGRTKSDTPAKFTNSAGSATYDLVWVNMDMAGAVRDLEVTSTFLGSNHLPVSVGLNGRGSGVFPRLATRSDSQPPNIPKLPNQIQHPRLKWNPEGQEKYTLELTRSAELVADPSLQDTEELNASILNAIWEGARLAGMEKNPPLKSGINTRRPRNPWFDSECAQAKKELKKRFDKMYHPKFDVEWAEAFNEGNKSYKKQIAEKKLAYKRDVMQRFSNIRNANVYWKTVREMRGWKPRIEVIDLDSWSKFLHNTYPPRIRDDLSYLPAEKNSMDDPISLEELNNAIKGAKGGKAPGNDGISVEFFKLLPEVWKNKILMLFNSVFESGSIPKAWASIVLCMIFKKGDQSDPLNYRGIALINVITKLFTAILNSRVYKWAELQDQIPDEQGGFRINRGVRDNIYSLQTIIPNRLRLQGAGLCTFRRFQTCI